MKKLLIMLGVLLCWASVALAAVTVTQQPVTQTVKAGGKVSFSAKAKGAGNGGITWHFVEESSGEDVTGRKLSERFKGLKVKNPNTLTITLQNVPEEMHGWQVYCHIGPKNGGVDTDRVQLLIEGLETGEAAEAAEAEPAEEKDPDAEAEEEPAEDGDPDAEAEAEPAEDGNPDAEAEAEPAEDGDPDAEAEPAGDEDPDAEAEAQPAVSSRSGAADSSDPVYPEILGYRDPDQYQFLQLGTYYYDENGGKAPLLWRILYREGNRLTLFTEYIIDTHQMYETDTYYDRTQKKKYKSHFNDPYEEQGIYFWLNGEMAETIFSDTDFSSAIIPHKVKETYKNEANESDVPEWPDEYTEAMIAAGGGEEDPEKFPYGRDLFYIMTYGDMMKEWYGFPPTFSGDAIEQPGEIAVPEAGRRKTWATPYARNKIIYPQWKKKLQLTVMSEYNGTSPYWAVKRRKNYYMTGIVGGNGHLSWRAMDSVQIGVRPAMRLDLSRLKLTGGKGTREDPWRMTMP